MLLQSSRHVKRYVDYFLACLKGILEYWNIGILCMPISARPNIQIIQYSIETPNRGLCVPPAA